MSRRPVRPLAGRAPWGLPVLSLGMILALASFAPLRADEERKPEPSSSKGQVSVEALPPGIVESARKAGVVTGGSVAFIDEAEPNDTTATAQVLGPTPVRVRANLYRAPLTAGVDVDVFSFTAPANARVYAGTMTSFSSGSTDTTMDIIDVDGTTVLETDNNDGTFSGSSSNVGGTLLVTGGTYFVRVSQVTTTSLTGTVRPYDLYVKVQPDRKSVV